MVRSPYTRPITTPIVETGYPSIQSRPYRRSFDHCWQARPDVKRAAKDAQCQHPLRTPGGSSDAAVDVHDVLSCCHPLANNPSRVSRNGPKTARQLQPFFWACKPAVAPNLAVWNQSDTSSPAGPQKILRQGLESVPHVWHAWSTRTSAMDCHPSLMKPGYKILDNQI